MNKETQLVLDVWEVFRDVIPAAKRTETAEDMLNAFEEYGIEGSEIASIVDEDPVLREAFSEVFPDDVVSGLDDEEDA